MKRRLLSILLTLCMVTALLPAVSITAKAGTDVFDYGTAPSDTEMNLRVEIPSNSDTFLIPVCGRTAESTYDIAYGWNVDWGDGNSTNESGSSSEAGGIEHTYDTSGTYTITIKPNGIVRDGWFRAFGFNNNYGGSNTKINKPKLAGFAGVLDDTSMGISDAGSNHYIGYFMFYNCTNLTAANIQFDTSATSVGDYFARFMFGSCTSLTSLPNGFNLPASITSVGNYFANSMFSNCTKLVSLPSGFNLPSGLTSVGDYFANCIFSKCENLMSLPSGFNLPSGITTVGNDFASFMFQNCTKLGALPEGFNLPSGITTAGDRFAYAMFTSCTNLVSLPSGFNLPGGITSAGNYFAGSMFASCTKLASLPDGFNLPDSITSAGDYFADHMFYCVKFETLPSGFTFPSGITSVGGFFAGYMFCGCTELISLPDGFNLPDSITSVGEFFAYYMFTDCTKLASLPDGFNLPGGITTVGHHFAQGILNRCANLASLPSGFNLPSGITSVGDNFAFELFSGCTSLMSLPSGFNLPSGITSVGNCFAYSMFNSCANLASLPSSFNLPGGITTVGNYFAYSMFNNCTNLKMNSAFRFSALTEAQINQSGMFNKTFYGITAEQDNGEAAAILSNLPDDTGEDAYAKIYPSSGQSTFSEAFNNDETWNLIHANWKGTDSTYVATPTVGSVSVTSGSSAAAISGNIIITFSAEMDTAGTVSLTTGDTTTNLTGGEWSGGTTYTVPYSGLAYGTTYTIKISAFKNTSGTAMSDDSSNAFTTIPIKSAVTLTADEDVSVDGDIEITFTADSAFETAISGVNYNGHALTANQYTVGSGTVTLHPGSTDNTYLQTPGTADVVVRAAGYTDSSVSQTITAGAVASLQVTTQPEPGLKTGDAFAVQPVVKLYDQYGNLCSTGLSASASVTAAAKAGTGSWTLGGTTTKPISGGVATFTDLTCTLETAGDGVITFSCGEKSVDSSSFAISERNSSITPATASFDKYTRAADYKDIDVTVVFNSNTLVAIKNGIRTLSSGTDYTVSGNICTISKTYLATLSAGTANLIFDFSSGVDPVLSIAITDSAPLPPASGFGDSSGGSTSSNNFTDVEVNGNAYNAGTTSKTTSTDGQTQTTVVVDTNKLNTILNQRGEGATVTVPVTNGSDVTSATLTGELLSTLQNHNATLIIKTDSASYSLPTSDLDMSAITKQFGNDVDLSDMAVNVTISEPTNATASVVADAADEGGFTIVAPAVDFTVTSTYNGQTTTISAFRSYVQRMIAVPDSVKSTKITTGVVVEPDGTVHHVPTKVTIIDGKYYAVISSLTNSTYTVIWHPVEFTDVTDNWAKDAINDMGSRMIVTGYSNGNYNPNNYITRAGFATILVRALGLEPSVGTNSFADVKPTDWYHGYIETATACSIISGYADGTFCPNDQITREQAMAIIARAMTVTGLETHLSDSGIHALLKNFSDGPLVSNYAQAGVAACIKTGIVTGKKYSAIAPTDTITRAEVAIMVQRLLQKSGLI